MGEIDFEELDRQLTKLVREAISAESPLERQRSLEQLFRLLSQPRVLHPPQLNRHPPEVHRDLYNETCQRVFERICRNIDQYDPQKARLRKWVNYLLDKRFIDVVKERNGRRVTYVADLSELDMPVTEEDISDVQMLRDYITQDPKKEFRKRHIKGHPKASFQMIALRILDGRTWKEISKEYDIPISSLSAFYQRCLKKFAPDLRNFLSH